MTCTAPWTMGGTEAVDPTGGAAFADCAAPLVTADEYECYPGACPPPADCEEFVDTVLRAVSDKVAEWYGFDLRPCERTMHYRLRCDKTMIVPTLRVETVRVGRRGCPECPPVWTDVDLCDVIVGSASGVAPWTSLELCRTAAACGDRVEVAGVTGLAWPIPESVRVAVMAMASKVLRSASTNSPVLASQEDGRLASLLSEFAADEFALLPRTLVPTMGVAL